MLTDIAFGFESNTEVKRMVQVFWNKHTVKERKKNKIKPRLLLTLNCTSFT